MNLMNLISILGLWQAANREYFTTSDGSAVAKVTEGNAIFYSIKNPNETYTVNLIELPTQLVVIDFGINTADSQKAYNFARSLNKPMGACVLTHYHPDHFNGFSAWKDVCTKLMSLPETFALIENRYSDQANDFSVSANEVLNAASPVEPGKMFIDGYEFVLEKVLGVETDYFLLARMPKQQAVFVGDLVTDKGHHYLAENHDLSVWYEFWVKLRYVYGYRNVFLGHGFPVDWSKDANYKENYSYLEFVRNVANTYKTKEEYVSAILNKYPNYVAQNVVPFPFGF